MQALHINCAFDVRKSRTEIESRVISAEHQDRKLTETPLICLPLCRDGENILKPAWWRWEWSWRQHSRYALHSNLCETCSSRRVSHQHDPSSRSLCRWSTRNWCSSKSTCRGTCCAPTPRSCTLSSPFSPTTCRRSPPRGAFCPASPSISTPTRSWSGTRPSTSPPPSRRTAWISSTSGTKTSSSRRPWGAGWWVGSHFVFGHQVSCKRCSPFSSPSSSSRHITF